MGPYLLHNPDRWLGRGLFWIRVLVGFGRGNRLTRSSSVSPPTTSSLTTAGSKTSTISPAVTSISLSLATRTEASLRPTVCSTTRTRRMSTRRDCRSPSGLCSSVSAARLLPLDYRGDEWRSFGCSSGDFICPLPLWLGQIPSQTGQIDQPASYDRYRYPNAFPHRFPLTIQSTQPRRSVSPSPTPPRPVSMFPTLFWQCMTYVIRQEFP